ncbi:MAG: hypothetical protein IKX31_07825 [Muribaculaceae bacterium]|nr:hypothetical protein [Muribaculaceae bacterium]
MKRYLFLLLAVLIVLCGSSDMSAKRKRTNNRSNINMARAFMSAERTICTDKDGTTVRIKCVNTIRPVLVISIYKKQLFEVEENEETQLVLTMDNGEELTKTTYYTKSGRNTVVDIELTYDVVQDLKSHSIVKIDIYNQHDEMSFMINPKTWKKAYNSCYREMPNKDC